MLKNTFKKLLLLFALISRYNDASVSPPQPPPGQCPEYPSIVGTEKQLTLPYIRSLASSLYEEFLESDSQCFRLVSVRIYGALQLSPELAGRGVKF